MPNVINYINYQKWLCHNLIQSRPSSSPLPYVDETENGSFMQEKEKTPKPQFPKQSDTIRKS